MVFSGTFNVYFDDVLLLSGIRAHTQLVDDPWRPSSVQHQISDGRQPASATAVITLVVIAKGRRQFLEFVRAEEEQNIEQADTPSFVTFPIGHHLYCGGQEGRGLSLLVL